MKEINWETKEKIQLIKAILALKNADETRRFLRDLMTEKEIKEFSNRLEAASLLSQDVQYNTIIEDTGLSSTTIARISKWLKGPPGGYRLILSRISNTSKKLNSNHHHNSSKLKKGLSLSS
ncbi:MAG: TrpR-related protein YerC/YecD [Candidatus Nomurabacteria bacterium GW2011_GWE1_32_28]|uniref:TrpR-related protein YerC/YecD n=1 Tax=Candidatus Nomurabacteria bacterium GW2011_GWF1_31_48 TaxID=1618767 RepID=A0A0F9YGH5_9BACT|nr:MAG: TrpR-related protein YerC/YecD [Candidatus Nomurabacteria bacterium GW2011_GWF2_30_133]KKP28951.1 MAG: TrpR-related protein YerC/YecD [Candidatus Nomurabacteria bacterium GW2011_GWE2_31_40]KKP30689.1 MAG: TrpR-related protein YerC/YecD [Candidatus Nomurabacteria bacterium GW2011_GWF1_31_48]KKP35207.1 MAG: TrpR-related protein YerC/YecD [Candidatus Nomurabacteria bacterium GW2011_GWE1_32_28]HAS80517.1 DNA-binding transcriptional regulator [Candidatus Nomurabacteria bacterium]